MSEISNTSTTLFAREVKVRTLQYKLTVFIIALGLFVAWPFLTDLWSRYQTTQDTNTTLTQEIEKKDILQTYSIIICSQYSIVELHLRKENVKIKSA